MKPEMTMKYVRSSAPPERKAGQGDADHSITAPGYRRGGQPVHEPNGNGLAREGYQNGSGELGHSPQDFGSGRALEGNGKNHFGLETERLGRNQGNGFVEEQGVQSGKAKAMIRYIVRALGWLVMLFGCYLIIGYVVGRGAMYTYPNGSTPVALPTSIGFAVVGLSLFLGSYIRNGKE